MLSKKWMLAVLLLLLGITVIALGPVTTFDRYGVTLLRDAQTTQLLGPQWFAITARDVTALGSNWILVYLVVGTCLALGTAKKVKQATALAIMVLGGIVLSMGTKYVFVRPRPDIVEHLIHTYTPSFPSGHAMMSMVCFLGTALVCNSFIQSKPLRVTLLCFAILSSVLVGGSRIVLGVHWPTDVIAGWLFGWLWVMLVMRSMKLHHA